MVIGISPRCAPRPRAGRAGATGRSFAWSLPQFCLGAIGQIAITGDGTVAGEHITIVPDAFRAQDMDAPDEFAENGSRPTTWPTC